MRNWHEAIADEAPELIDTGSSPTTVYLRKDIREVERKDETTGETRTEYHYMEKEYSKIEYMLLTNSDNTGRISDIEDAVVELAEMIVGGE